MDSLLWTLGQLPDDVELFAAMLLFVKGASKQPTWGGPFAEEDHHDCRTADLDEFWRSQIEDVLNGNGCLGWTKLRAWHSFGSGANKTSGTLKTEDFYNFEWSKNRHRDQRSAVENGLGQKVYLRGRVTLSTGGSTE